MWIPDEGKFLDCMFMTIPPNHTPLSTEIEVYFMFKLYKSYEIFSIEN